MDEDIKIVYPQGTTKRKSKKAVNVRIKGKGGGGSSRPRSLMQSTAEYQRYEVGLCTYRNKQNGKRCRDEAIVATTPGQRRCYKHLAMAS